MKNKEELLYELSENVWESREKRHTICILTYHHESIGNPAYISSLLQSIKQMTTKSDALPPFLVFANSNESMEIQFGKDPKTRTLAIRAAAKNGLKGLVVGDLDDPKTASTFLEKIMEIIEGDELIKMTSFERYLRKLINRAYVYLNKIFGSAEEKEENINKAIGLFEEVLEQSKDNCEALLGKATACSSSSDPDKILEGSELFAKLEVVGEDMERTYEGHAGACYKMAELVEEKVDKHKWMLKGVNSLESLVTWQVSEYKAIQKAQQDYNDPELLKELSNKYSTMATSLAEIGGKHRDKAIEYYMNGIEQDPTVVSNYKVVSLLEDNARKAADHMKIVKICMTARENLAGKEIDFLFREAEAYFNAGRQHDATKLFNSINMYVSKDQIEAWGEDKKNGIIPGRKIIDRITAVITFLNHRAIYFRKIGNYEKSFADLDTSITLDVEDNYYDIYFNMAKAIFSSISDKNVQSDYTKKDAFNYVFTSIKIASNINFQTYEKLLKTVKEDAVLSPFVKDIRHHLEENEVSIPLFFK